MGLQVFTVQGTDWQLELLDPDGSGVISNFVLRRASDKHFHGTMVDDSVTTPDGKEIPFRQPLFIEHHQPGQDKIGDVVIVFRRNPETGRYAVQTDEENVFEDENTVYKAIRATRSSVDNTVQAVKKKVNASGRVNANARRIGGKTIKTHYVVSGWSRQLEGNALDVFDYVDSLDAIGLAAFLKALKYLPEQLAQVIFSQMRSKKA